MKKKELLNNIQKKEKILNEIQEQYAMVYFQKQSLQEKVDYLMYENKLLKKNYQNLLSELKHKLISLQN